MGLGSSNEIPAEHVHFPFFSCSPLNEVPLDFINYFACEDGELDEMHDMAGNTSNASLF